MNFGKLLIVPVAAAVGILPPAVEAPVSGAKLPFWLIVLPWFFEDAGNYVLKSFYVWENVPYAYKLESPARLCPAEPLMVTKLLDNALAA